MTVHDEICSGVPHVSDVLSCSYHAEHFGSKEECLGSFCHQRTWLKTFLPDEKVAMCTAVPQPCLVLDAFYVRRYYCFENSHLDS